MEQMSLLQLESTPDNAPHQVLNIFESTASDAIRRCCTFSIQRQRSKHCLVFSSPASFYRPDITNTRLLWILPDSTVLFPRGAESILTSASIPFEVSSKKATLGFPYVSLDVLSDAVASADFGQFIERLILSVCSFDVFACCSRYQDCSDAGTCQMSDPLYSVACQYRKNLLAGKNFYSKKSPACNRPD